VADVPRKALRGQPRVSFEEMGSFLEPFCKHLSPKVDAIFENKSLIEVQTALREFLALSHSIWANRFGEPGLCSAPRLMNLCFKLGLST